MNQSVPRYAPGEQLPPYAYTPGKTPHPISNPQGHWFGQPELHAVAPTDWRDSPVYLQGVDLFNHGYYWESHERWEAIWRELDRPGAQASFYKGLIKLAAAGVKSREGRSQGVLRHARRAGELFNEVDPDYASRMGLSLSDLTEFARLVAANPDAVIDTSDAPVVRTLPFLLVLCEG